MTKTTKGTAKKEFAWDTEVMVKEIAVNDFEKRVISITSLGKKEFVVIATHKNIKGEWKPVKNATVPKELWSDIVDAVTDYDLAHAFGSTTELQAPAKKAPKKTTAPKKEKAPKKETPATIKGIKSSFEDKLKRNPNWSKLSAKQKADALISVTNEHDEFGMVTIAISGTNYIVASGKNQQQAEQQLKAVKGFSRAQVTFFA